jgi:DNA-binding NtrC family response regulator
VRILATTNRDLLRAVADGAFRRDLYYRLNVVPIHVPPLRDRAQDIPELAEYFLEQFVRGEGRPSRRLSPAAVGVLARYEWPGNVRELENVIERASVLELGPEIRPEHLAGWLEPIPTEGQENALAPGTTLREAERQLILTTLEHFGGHRARTAEALGIGLRTLTSKIQQYGDEARAAGREPCRELPTKRARSA